MQYCSLLHWLYLNHQSHSWLGLFALAQPLHSFELFLHSSPVTYWSPTDLGSSSFSVISFCLFILFMGFSRQDTEVVCHSLLQWATFCQNSPAWPIHLVCPCTAWLKVHVIVVFILSALWWLRIRGLCKLPWCEGLAVGESVSCSDVVFCAFQFYMTVSTAANC